TPLSPRPLRRTVLSQAWLEVTFLHWPIDPALVAPHLPPGVRPDVHDGVTWVGLVPFGMRGLGFGRGPGLPWVGDFLETNVRVYGVDGRGRRGVVFLTLECERLLPVLGSRAALRLPYRWAAMGRRREGRELTWTSRRITPPGVPAPGSLIRVGVGEPIRAGDLDPLDAFLTARWGLHTRWHDGSTLHLPNVHPTWPLHRAELLECREDLIAACGLPAPVGTPRVLFAPRVDVRFGPPDRLPPVPGATPMEKRANHSRARRRARNLAVRARPEREGFGQLLSGRGSCRRPGSPRPPWPGP
ncbi:YqjF family protein, partial [Streptomyces calidiresistens]